MTNRIADALVDISDVSDGGLDSPIEVEEGEILEVEPQGRGRNRKQRSRSGNRKDERHKSETANAIPLMMVGTTMVVLLLLLIAALIELIRIQ